MIQAVEKYLYYAFRRASLHCSHRSVGPGHPFKIRFRAELAARQMPRRNAGPKPAAAAAAGAAPAAVAGAATAFLGRSQQLLQGQRLLQQQLAQPRSQGAGWRRLRRLSPRHDGSSAGRGRRDFTQPASPSFHREKSLLQFRAIFNAHGRAGWTLRFADAAAPASGIGVFLRVPSSSASARARRGAGVPDPRGG